MATQQQLFTATSGGTGYTKPLQQNGGWNATFALGSNKIYAAGRVSRLYVYLDTAPGGATSRTFTVYKNGSATGITFTISGASLSGFDVVHFADFAANDDISVRGEESGGAAFSSRIRIGLEWRAAAGTGKAIYGAAGVAVNAGQAFMIMYGDGLATSSPGTRSESVITTDGQFDGYAVTLSVAPGAGTSRTYAIYKNGTIYPSHDCRRRDDRLEQ
jgi:hypothetical protein